MHHNTLRMNIRRLASALPELVVAAAFLYAATTTALPAGVTRELSNAITGTVIAILTFPFISSAFLFEAMFERAVVVFVALLIAFGVAAAHNDVRILADAVVMFAITYAGFFAVDLRDMEKTQVVTSAGARWVVSAAVYLVALVAAPFLARILPAGTDSERMLTGAIVYSALVVCEIGGFYPAIARGWLNAASRS